MNAQAQYETPPEWARFFSELLPQAYNEKSVFDPQCASGNLLAQAGYNSCRLGFEIDNRYRQEKPGRVNRTIGNCVKGWEALDDLFPDARFHCQVANPPFGLIWRLPDGTTADSTLYTWRKIKGRAAEKGYGYFVANSKTIERLGIDKDPLVYLYQKFPVGVFSSVDVAVGVVHWQNTPALDRPAYQRLEYTTLDRHEHDDELAKVRSFHLKGFYFADSQQPEGGWFDAWVQIQKVLDEERTKRPPFNIWLGADGKLKTYLSTRTQVKHKLTRADINQIARVSDCHPLALTTDRETRNLLSELLSHGFYVIQPEAKEAITNSLAAVAALACPIMPISDFMRVAYADEEDTLVCKEHDTNLPFIPTKCYSLDTATYSFSQKFSRDKVHFDEESGKTYTAKHECFLSGQDRFISIKDDDGHTHRFMDKPDKAQPYDHDEALLWSIFAQPKVNTIADANPKMVAANLELLRTCELLSAFTYYPGQLDYLARVACKDYALVAADVGCHAKGTQILMADGSLKAVEDIVPGDSIQGWDDTPRLVTELKRGRDQMVWIFPVKGSPFRVNRDHVLTLVQTNVHPSRKLARTNGRIVDVAVRDWLKWSKEKKENHKLFRVPVTSWRETEQKLPPYFVGLLLGDGHLGNGISICKPDQEIDECVHAIAEKCGWIIRTNTSQCTTHHFTNCQDLREEIDRLGLRHITSGDKFIPNAYKICSWNQRLEILAGLLDTDAHLTCNGYDFISKSHQLARDVTFIARSLGLAAYITRSKKTCQTGAGGLYFRVSISGDCSIIPCKIARKQSTPRQQKKSVLRTGFTVYSDRVDDFYGFSITGDGRYVMGDFTVTHNTGKTLMALSLIQMKAPQRALIIAPQGTLRSSESDDDEDEVEYKASQWVEEIRRFAPGLPVFELFSFEDYQRILKANGGVMPEGVFISYYQAMFQNGALERLPDSWDDLRLATEGQKILGAKKALPLPPPPEGAEAERYWCDLVGREVNGIRCILKPCLATIVGDHFDMICLDEAHICSNLDANVTQMLIRMQPKFRFAFTATPIPNIVTNLFSVMGWLCVTDWYKGERRNAAWPYARAELQRFSDTFQAKERDVTEEEMKKARNKDWRGKCEKSSPVISSPARLLKILTPTLAFISKEACNPNLVQRQIIDVRVPMGKEQSRLYAHFLDRGNIHAKSALVRARKQVAYLRNICADPAGFTHGGPRVSSNYNPKTVAILELTKEIIGRGEQVVIVSARVGQSNTLALKLKEAGLSVARIDSTVPADQHSAQSAAFKAKKAQVLIMGIKCAMGHSYDDCQNLIIGNLEYSYGAKHQAEGRIFRVNSKKNVRIYCILCKHSIEETMFDVVATKQDAATICLYGKRVPRDFKPVEMGEVLAQSMNNYQDIGVSERECEDQWPKLRAVFGRLASN